MHQEFQWRVITYNDVEVIPLGSGILFKAHSIEDNDHVGDQ
jgi:hypothetical protein